MAKTFGDATEEIALLNYPIEERLGLSSKILYILSICGSFLIFIQPIYSYIDNVPLVRELISGDNTYSSIWFTLFRFITVYTLVAISLGVGSIIHFVELLGPVVSIVANVLIPLVLYNKVTEDSRDDQDSDEETH